MSDYKRINDIEMLLYTGEPDAVEQFKHHQAEYEHLHRKLDLPLPDFTDYGIEPLPKPTDQQMLDAMLALNPDNPSERELLERIQPEIKSVAARIEATKKAEDLAERKKALDPYDGAFWDRPSVEGRKRQIEYLTGLMRTDPEQYKSPAVQARLARLTGEQEAHEAAERQSKQVKEATRDLSARQKWARS